ncbi:hypothetical protein MLD38_020744 [Melastoma candidum]|uniref:Uncharacterized protein n=1 Tax=Melastoma candidum TaxID=119954 RepID=A0ACB9QGW8_9MYRT|nr:hypothetical protein MLD38_020744 [Melastoma candidum]
MGSKAEEAQELARKMSMSMPRTPGRKLLEVPSSPATSGTQTPPFHPPASVPFRWEQEPGKPRPCSALVFMPRDPPVEYLGLPPGLSAPPTTTLPLLLQPPRLQAPSFRMGGVDPVHKKRWRRGPAWFGSWTKWGVNEEAEVIGSRSYVFPSVDWGFEGEENGGRRTRSRIGSGCSFHIMPPPTSHLWRSIHKGLKGAIPWRRRSPKKNTGS